MANTSFLQTSDLDFDTLKSNLKEFLRSQTALQDYNFEGSNLSVLLDILTYNTYVNGQYLNMIGSEMFLDSSQLKESVISHSKELHYIPRSRSAATAIINVQITPVNSPATVTIPKYTVFKSNFSGQTVNFVTTSTTTIRNNGGIYVAQDLEIKEGEVVTEFFNVTNPTDGETVAFVLQSDNIDISTVEVEIYETSLADKPLKWQLTKDVFGINGTDKVFFIEGYARDKYKILFGNGVIGQSLKDGNIVKVSYLDTLGEGGNNASIFSKVGTIDGHSNISITTSSIASGGSERESTQSIKFNAPRYFETQERTVTTNDYENVVLANFPQIQAVVAYGGELAEPKQYGSVIVSLKPFGTYGVVSDIVKGQVVTLLQKKNMTTTPVIVNPDYFFIGINSIVQYNKNITAKTPSTLKSEIIQSLAALNLSSFNAFGKDLRYSKVLSVIDNTDPSIISNDTVITMIKRWTPATGRSVNLQFSFGNQLKTEDVLYVHPPGHDAIVSSSTFSYISDNVTYNAFFQDDGVGNIYVFTVTTDGTRVVLNPSVGSVDYQTGNVDISLNVAGFSNYIMIFGTTEAKDIFVTQNQFLIIDAIDIEVNVIEAIE